jgi:hypothetical protein
MPIANFDDFCIHEVKYAMYKRLVKTTFAANSYIVKSPMFR